MPERQLSVELRQIEPIPLDVAFTCGAGAVLAIFGPSGSGKTTILRSIAGLHRAAHAIVRVGNEVWTDTSAGVVLPPHRRGVGFVFQDYALFPHLTAMDNVIAALGHLPTAEHTDRARSLLAAVHLAEHHDRRPRSLSGGERQRVALARALARDPAVLLLDEPFAAIDRAVRRQLQGEIAALRRSLDLPIVLVTHDFDDVVRLASHVLLVSDRTLGKDTIVRVRIPAREVILATTPPEGVSLHNALAGTITAIDATPRFEHVIVQVAVGRVPILAEVTRDAIARLGLAVGGPVHALVKSVSIELLG